MFFKAQLPCQNPYSLRSKRFRVVLDHEPWCDICIFNVRNKDVVVVVVVVVV